MLCVVLVSIERMKMSHARTYFDVLHTCDGPSGMQRLRKCSVKGCIIGDLSKHCSISVGIQLAKEQHGKLWLRRG
jgi:hypothetical protein